MNTIFLNPSIIYNKAEKTFSISERNVAFATSYKVINLRTNNSVVFNFSHSTGPEFDHNTKWIYKSDNGLTLEVCNDKIITDMNAANYLTAKTRCPLSSGTNQA